MDSVDIFESSVPQTGEFKKWVKIGDAVQGTYIGVNEGVDSYGNEQMIYTLKDRDGKIWNIGIKKTVGVVVDRMSNAKFGYIVGFRYEEDRVGKKPGLQPAKIVRVYYDSLIIDKEWVAQRMALGGSEEDNLAPLLGGNSAGEKRDSSVTAPASATPITPAIPEAPAQA